MGWGHLEVEVSIDDVWVELLRPFVGLTPLRIDADLLNTHVVHGARHNAVERTGRRSRMRVKRVDEVRHGGKSEPQRRGVKRSYRVALA